MDGQNVAEAAIERTMRRNAIGVIIGASELVGAHGLHLTMREVEQMPEDVLQALRVLGVTDAELAEADTGD